MRYRVLLKMDGRWRDMARGFYGFDGATRWAQEVMAMYNGDEVSGYRVEEMGGRVVCSVERSA